MPNDRLIVTYQQACECIWAYYCTERSQEAKMVAAERISEKLAV